MNSGYENIANELKQNIISNKYKVGELLPSVLELCEQYQVSRPTIREALSALKIMGYIETKQGRGSIVKEYKSDDFGLPDFHPELLSKTTFIELMEARKEIELSMVTLAAKKRTTEDIKQLQQIINKMELNVLNGDQDESEQLDMTFHMQLAEATHNSIIKRLLQTIFLPLETAMREIRKITFADELFSKNIFQEHYKIYSTILNQDENEARKQMTLHLKHFEAQVQKYIDQNF